MSLPPTLLFVPCFNEQGRIGSLVRRIDAAREHFDELLLVDDGSTDRSVDEIRQAGVACTVLSHPQRRGLGEAFRTAYRHALARRYEVFCVMAGNGKDDPAQLGRVVGPVRQGHADYVQGSRFHPEGGRSERLPVKRNLAIRSFTAAVSVLCRRRLTDASNGFRAYRTALLDDPAIDWCAPWLGSSYQVEIHLLLCACRSGYRVLEVPVDKIYPSDGRPYSKAVPGDWFRMCRPLLGCALGLDRGTGERHAPGTEIEGLRRITIPASTGTDPSACRLPRSG